MSDFLNHDDSDYSFRVIRLLRPQKKWRRVPQTIWAIARYAEDADVLFANGLFLESVVAARWKRKPLVMKIVGDWAWERGVNKGWTADSIDDFQKRRYSLRVESLKKLRSSVTRCADAVFTPSRYLRRIVEGWGVKPNRLHVIYNALEPLNDASPMPLPPFAGKTVVTVARLVALKGIDRLMRTVASLPAVRLIVVGDGPEMASLKRLAGDLELGERVIFTGQVSSKEVEQYLRASHLFVLNSTYVEGLPHVVLESMAVGIPVIATDVGGTGEIVQHEVNGLLIPPRDDEALRSSIVRLLQNPDECTRYVNAGYDTIAKHFQWNQLVESTEELLSTVAKKTISEKRED